LASLSYRFEQREGTLYLGANYLPLYVIKR
jgi:hypothetical protein